MNNVQILSLEFIKIIKNHLNSSTISQKLNLSVDNNPNIIREFINQEYPFEGPHSIMQSRYIN
jgi:hypothetical protein